MPEILKKTFSAFSGAFILCAVILRTVIVLFYTDASTGFVRRSAAGITAAFCFCCVFSVLFCAAPLYKSAISNPFDKHKNKLIFYTGIFSGAAMFCDFVYQCVNLYRIFINGGFAELNYTIPLCLTAVSSVLCAFYFIIMGVSYKTDKYDFRCLKYYHIIPLCRHLFAVFMSLTRYNDGIYSLENIMYYAVLISGMVYFILFLGCLDGNVKILKPFCIVGFLYGVLCVVLTVPRIAGALYADVFADGFSSAVYLFMGILSFSLSAAVLKKDRLEEG